jgi:DNA-binding Lrp family transcriptional regulator
MLTKLEKQVLGLVQGPLALCQRPFAAVGRRVGCSAGRVMETIADLKGRGYIRRFGAAVNYAALGRRAALVAGAVPAAKLDRVVATVNSLEGVSHHYLRKHAFNLWFTLQDTSLRKIESVLRRLEEQVGVRFYSLPAQRVFKLDARFNPQGPSLMDFQPVRVLEYFSNYPRVSLTRTEKKVLLLLQGEFPIVERPFDVLAAKSGIEDVLEIAKTLAGKGVIRRIAAVAAYRRLGYTANAMVCFVVHGEDIEAAAEWLSQRPAVSHCYQRRTFDGWPYNLFAMMHGGRKGDLRDFAAGAARRFGISDWVLLPTEREIKKQPVMID